MHASIVFSVVLRDVLYKSVAHCDYDIVVLPVVIVKFIY